MTSKVPTFSDIEDAAARIQPHVHHTPVFTSATLDSRSGASLFCKAENLQKVGAFKARGATNAVLSLAPEDLAKGVATHSSGNHGQAVAYAANIVGTRATVVMPNHAPAVKVDAVKGYGATVVKCPHAEREATLASVVEATGATVVHPFDNRNVIAGQGTAALELIGQVPDLDIIITPIGGGGLLSGTTLVASAHGIEAVGAEPEVVDDAFRSLAAGRLIPLDRSDTVADGLRTSLSELTFSILRAHLTAIQTVSEAEILRALRSIWERMKILVEPSSAVTLAALEHLRGDLAGRRVGLILSGGNVDLDALPMG